jgi:20S proteasome alpha/beta subunit
MTLILAIPTKNGVIIASDGQVTLGAVRYPEKKIKQLNEYCLWSASGELALIQRVEELISKFPNKEQPLNTIRDPISKIIKDALTILLQNDFRTQFINPPSAENLLQLHPGDFIFVEYFNKDPKVLHILSNGTAEWITKTFASGSGALFAYALLQKYQDRKLDIQKASLLAYKVIEESIEVGSWGLGLPIDIWQINKDGSKNLTVDDISALADSAKVLREGEVRLLIE